MNDAATVALAIAAITGTLAFLTTLLNALFNYKKDGRDREWALQDREQAQRIENNRAADAVKLHDKLAETNQLATLAVAKTDTLAAKTDSVAAQVQGNTIITTQGTAQATAAYEAANGFNDKLRKFEEMQQTILELIKQDRERSQQQYKDK